MAGLELRYQSVKPAAEASGVLPWLMLMVALLVQTSFQGGMQSTGPLAPFIQADLQITRAQVGLFSSGFSLVSLLVVFAAGWLADRIGARLLLFGGTSAIALSLILTSREPSYWAMVALFSICGVGVSLCSVGATQAVVGWFSTKTRGTAMGIKQTGTSLGVAIGAATLPALALAIGWRSAMGLAGATVAAAGLIALVFYRDRRSTNEIKPARPRGSLRTALQRNICFACMGGISLTVVQMSLVLYLVLYLTEALRMEVTTAGSLLALANLVAVAARILFGIVSDRLFGARRKGLLIFTALGSVAGALAIGGLGTTLPFSALVVLLAFLGLVGMGWTGMFMILVPELAGKQASGVGAAAALASCNIGALIGAPLFGLVVDVSRSYTVAWLVLAAIAALGAAAFAIVRESAWGTEVAWRKK